MDLIVDEFFRLIVHIVEGLLRLIVLILMFCFRLWPRSREEGPRTQHELNKMSASRDDNKQSFIRKVTKRSSPRTKRVSGMCDIPNEILLQIGAYLDRPAKVLLSLTCKRFRCVIESEFDLMLYDLDERVYFLRRLEKDLPEHLTCRLCGWMFLWRGVHLTLSCRRHVDPPYNSPQTEHAWYKHENDIGLVRVSYEYIDLVLRAYLYGPKYGISSKRLNTSTFEMHKPKRNSDGIEIYNESRRSGGGLLLFTSYSIKVRSREEVSRRRNRFDDVLCTHYRTRGRSHQPGCQVTRLIPDPMAVGEVTFHKCPYCMLDTSLSVESLPTKLWQITLKAWRRFEHHSSSDWRPFDDQMFRMNPAVRMESVDVETRDLRSQFELATKEHNNTSKHGDA